MESIWIPYGMTSLGENTIGSHLQQTVTKVGKKNGSTFMNIQTPFSRTSERGENNCANDMKMERDRKKIFMQNSLNSFTVL